MAQARTFLPSRDVSLHWAPESYISPCFSHFSPDNATMKCLTGAVKAVHDTRAAYNALACKAAADKAAWDELQQQLETDLNALKVRNAEAERLYKRQEQQIQSKLDDTAKALDNLQSDHADFRDTSTDTIKQLEQKVARLQQTCNDLESERVTLQDRLKDAELTAQARREAERRVAELEAGIAATQARAQEWVRSLTRQRDQAAASRDDLREHLTATQRALQQRTRDCQEAMDKAKRLLLSNHQLTNSLYLERIINEPLRHTHHASSTMAHVMRSQAASFMEDRAHLPLRVAARPPLSTLPTPLAEATSPVRLVADTTISPATPLAATQDAAAAPPVAAQAQGNVTHAEPEFLDATFSPQQAALTVSAPGTPARGPAIASGGDVRSVGGSALVRLGRAWATTTTTAAYPHSAYPDNPARFHAVYGVSPAKSKASQPSTHSRSATKRSPTANAGATGSMQAASVPPPKALEAKLSDGEPAASSQSAHARGSSRKPRRSSAPAMPSTPPRRPTEEMLRTYKEVRSSAPTTPPTIPRRAVVDKGLRKSDRLRRLSQVPAGLKGRPFAPAIGADLRRAVSSGSSSSSTLDYSAGPSPA